MCPAKYEIEIHNAQVSLRANWLFRFIIAQWNYSEQKSSWKLRVGWWQPNKNKNRKKPQVKTRRKNTITKENQKENQSKKSSNTEVKTKPKWTEIIKYVKMKEPYIRCIKKVFVEFLFLLQKSKPKRLEGHVEFGFDDPSETGKTLAFLATCYPILEDRIEIWPNFEEKIFNAEIYGSGNVYFYHLFRFVIKIFGDKDVKKTIKDIKKMRSIKEEA
jgi:hypothetical protein